MSTPQQCRSDAGRLVEYLLGERIAIAANTPVERRKGNIVTVEPAVGWVRSDDQELAEFASIAEYLEILRSGNYLCVLSDGSAMQVSLAFRHTELIKHRFAFFPCPVSILTSDLEEGTPLDEIVEYYLEDDWQSRIRLRSPLRFDFDPEAAREGHPASHLHFIGNDCRWPVFGPLSLGHFVRTIFKHFYPRVWEEHSLLRSWNMEFGLRHIVPAEELDLFIECRSGAA